MILSDSEKTWVVTGIAINKVVAPVLRDVVKQGMDVHYTNLDTYSSGLTTPCTLATLTYYEVHADPNLRRLKFQNINNNLIIHRNPTSSYNYTVNRLFDNYHSATTFSAAIQTTDAVRKDVRNKWGHFDVTECTEAFYSDCFSKLETLVRSLGLTGGKEKNTLDQLSDWRGKGCQLCMGHAVDKDLLSLKQTEVNGIIKDLALQSAQLFQVQQTAAVLQVRLDDGEATRKKGMKLILGRLTAIEENLGEELLRRVQGMEEKVEQVEQRATKADQKVDQLEQRATKTDQKVDQLEQRATKTDQKVNQMGQSLSDRMNQLELRVESEEPDGINICFQCLSWSLCRPHAAERSLVKGVRTLEVGFDSFCELYQCKSK
ncbi:uncharacterized protein LOC111328702 [Stylophora pistillata]|uniref:uncharacterized protein LOC111328702 n=1 Tax=Stylophora pistillata TaxID=50429 RepID=UPI000C057326|nr:uncharacterized protein LOC111328702 [Stylophora pistillata]